MEVLKKVQQFDPVGIGARNLALLVKVVGKVTSSATGQFYITDSSVTTPVKVVCPNLAPLTVGGWVAGPFRNPFSRYQTTELSFNLGCRGCEPFLAFGLHERRRSPPHRDLSELDSCPKP